MSYANFKKWTFYIEKVIFLGYIVSINGIEVDGEKIKAIKELPMPKGIFEVRAFYSLATFYRHFVKNFNTIAVSLTRIIKKSVVFH